VTHSLSHARTRTHYLTHAHARTLFARSAQVLRADVCVSRHQHTVALKPAHPQATTHTRATRCHRARCMSSGRRATRRKAVGASVGDRREVVCTQCTSSARMCRDTTLAPSRTHSAPTHPPTTHAPRTHPPRTHPSTLGGGAATGSFGHGPALVRVASFRRHQTVWVGGWVGGGWWVVGGWVGGARGVRA
jgi:hypothetical protein